MEAEGYPSKRLGVTWDNLTVTGKANSAVLHDTVLSLFDIPGKIRAGRRPVKDKTIVEESFGCVRPGQVLLVLARPGGGATTLLRVLSNNRQGYQAVEGDIRFGNLDHKEAEEFRGEIVMNTEEVSSLELPSLPDSLFCAIAHDWVHVCRRFSIPT
jgi:ATP-binding cassette subfamily G (WHITE) protein 2 (SNQ2)